MNGIAIYLLAQSEGESSIHQQTITNSMTSAIQI